MKSDKIKEFLKINELLKNSRSKSEKRRLETIKKSIEKK
jgi:hypothetical protein